MRFFSWFLILSSLIALLGCAGGKFRQVASTPLGGVSELRGSIYCHGALVDRGPVGGWISSFWTSDRISKFQKERDVTVRLRAVQAEYCPSGKPAQALKEDVRLILPRMPSGLPLDQAGSLRKDQLESARKQLESFFLELSRFKPIDEGDVRECSDREARVNFLNLPIADVRRFEEEYRDQALTGSGTEFFYVNLRSLQSRKIYLVPSRVEQFVLPENWMEESLESSVPERVGETAVSGLYVLPQEVVAQQGERRKLYPLREAYLAEIHLLRENFVLAMPSERKQLLPSRLIEQRDELWDRYLAAHMKIVESANDDPRIMDFEVSLNLEPFCRYGLPITEVLTREVAK